ncbi:MAG: nitroreductase family protein [SAR202 cluster bacterium]|nr:nitroreductase family protein [SAR202 cluster bacterium]
MTTADRLTMPLGEAMFTQRAIRRLKPDPIPDDVMRDLMEAAIRAPNGGNTQQWHFIVVKDADTRKQLGELYHEAWWAKRKDQGIMGPEDIPPGKNSQRSAMRLANEFGDAPVMVLICSLSKGSGAGIIPSAQNLLLAARSHGIGGTIATLHPVVEERVHKLLNIPYTAQIIYCMPLGYPRGEFGSVTRRPLEEVCGLDRWDNPYK